MEWSVNLTRHEIANLSRRGPTSARCGDEEKKIDRGKETEGQRGDNGTEREGREGEGHPARGVGAGGRAGKERHARFPAQHGQQDTAV